MDIETLKSRAKEFISNEFYHSQSDEWQKAFLGLYQDKIQLFPELNEKMNEVLADSVESNEALTDILSWETTPSIKEHIVKELETVEGEFVNAETFSAWMDYCKKELKIKGKPLFMGFRGVLTGQNHGPDLKVLIPLTPVSILKKRINSLD